MIQLNKFKNKKDFGIALEVFFSTLTGIII